MTAHPAIIPHDPAAEDAQFERIRAALDKIIEDLREKERP